MKKTFFIIALMFIGWAVQATDTKIVVRAKGRDAKFVGSSLGGAYVIIRNSLNNQILAEGKTNGSTGNTNLIMRTPAVRGKAIADAQTAKFMATIDIDEPTFVTIEVVSPLNKKQAKAVATTQLWLIPGKHILGDGIILEIPGFIIDILKPRTHHYIPLKLVKGKPFKIQANIVMMCGCTINKNGLWDSEKMEVKGILKKNGKPFKEVTLSLTSTNLFDGEVTLEAAGNYELVLYAYHPGTGNTGVDKVNYVIYK
jgi:hypothetical protein